MRNIPSIETSTCCINKPCNSKRWKELYFSKIARIEMKESQFFLFPELAAMTVCFLLNCQKWISLWNKRWYYFLWELSANEWNRGTMLWNIEANTQSSHIWNLQPLRVSNGRERLRIFLKHFLGPQFRWLGCTRATLEPVEGDRDDRW